jgi:uncharacterized protein (DUF4415 family)
VGSGEGRPQPSQTPGELRDSEPRGQTLGWVEGDVLLLVAHTVCTGKAGAEVIRIMSARRVPTRKRGSAMSKKSVKHNLEPDRLAPLTQQQKAEIDALKSASESEIDYSDIPPLTDEFWKIAVRNPFYRSTKSTTTVRLDTDVLLWLKSQGKGYQTRINAILREAMLKALHKKP